MAQAQHTPTLASLEGAITVPFCLVDDAYAHLNPRGQSHESLKKLTGSEILTLVLFQQLRGVESARSFLRDVQRFFVHLFPGVASMHPSSLQRRVRKLRRLEWNPCAGRSCLRLRLVIRRCVNPECEFYRHSHRPEQEGAFALPQGEFGLDVIALVGALRHAHHRSVPEIHRELLGRGVAVSERTVTNLLDRYEELVALRLTDRAALRESLKKQGVGSF